eukprot:3006924-Rhodomonas_salina.3
MPGTDSVHGGASNPDPMTEEEKEQAAELFRTFLDAVKQNVAENGTDWRARRKEMHELLGLKEGQLPPGLGSIASIARNVGDVDSGPPPATPIEKL